MMQTNKNMLLIIFIISFTFIVIFYGLFYYKNHKNFYNTINSIVITKDNLYSLIVPAPKELEKRVRDWFKKK